MKAVFNMNYEISVIIPAYNAERDLEKSVNSIINAIKTYTVEIIIVENGSVDHTWQEAKKIEKKYNDVRVVHSEKGVSHARNKGLEIALGKWICFVDADDEVTEEAFTEMHKIINQKADLFIFGYWKNNKKILPNIDNHISLSEKKVELIKNPTKYLAVWGKLFSLEIIRKNRIQFDPALSLSEDSDFLINYIRYCNDICFYNECIYIYNIQGNSSSRGYTGNKRQEYIRAIQTTQNKIEVFDKNVKHAFSQYIFMQMNLIMVKDVFCAENHTSFLKKCKELKVTCKKDIFSAAISDIAFKECTSLRLFPVILCKFHFWYLCGCIYWFRAIQNSHRSNKI